MEGLHSRIVASQQVSNDKALQSMCMGVGEGLRRAAYLVCGVFMPVTQMTSETLFILKCVCWVMSKVFTPGWVQVSADS
jgi:hypothetical protein